jgi:hypothetical protein
MAETSEPTRNPKKRGNCAELEQARNQQMEHSEKSDACFLRIAGRFAGNTLDATLAKIQRLIIDGVVEEKYTTPHT